MKFFLKVRDFGTFLHTMKLTQKQFKMNTIKPIRTKADYKNAIKRIDEIILTNPKKGSALYNELDISGTLAAAYEDIHFPIGAPDTVEAVKYIMEENHLKAKYLVPYFGSKEIVSEFLSHKRGLSVKIIKALHNGLGIPYKVLIA
jgi:HTH-type transcriptional regulator/antitoxin HigA